MPTCIFFGSFASIAIEWRPIPPKLGTHFAREGWSSRLFTIVQVSPRSSLLKSAAGTVPAHTTCGVFSCPGSLCQVYEKVGSAPACKSGFVLIDEKREMRTQFAVFVAEALAEAGMCAHERVQRLPDRPGVEGHVSRAPGEATVDAV